MATKRQPRKQTPRKRRPATYGQQERFLTEYAKHGNAKLACEYARISRPRHSEWLRDDPEYAKRFEEARLDAINVLEAEAHRRAVKGWEEPIVYQGSIAVHPKTRKPVTVRKFDSTLLIFLLKGAAPEKYRDTWKGEVKHTGTISQGPDLSALSDAQLDQLNQMLLLASGGTSLTLESSTGGDGAESPPQD